MRIASVFAAVTAMFFLLTGAASAQLVGRYAIDGQNPNGTQYQGTASVERTGDTFRVIWVVGEARFVGTGIGSDDALAITYRSGNNTGVALLYREAGETRVVWTYAGGTAVGAERWRRR
jgi:hypothetical protein